MDSDRRICPLRMALLWNGNNFLFLPGLILENEELHTEKALLARLSGGDRSAFEIIYRRYVRELYQAAYKRLDNREQVEDLVQDVFLKLWKRRVDLQVQNLGAYLHTAVRYEVLNYVVRNNASVGFYEPLEALLPDSDTPDNRLIAKELLELVYKYAETLPEKRKAVFLLHIKSRLSVDEIAEALNISPKTVHNHLGTAMNGLRKNIAPTLLLLLATRF